MHPSTPQADQVIVRAADVLNTEMIALADLRRGIAALRLGIPAAEDRLDYADDLLAIVKRQLMDASNIVDAAVERISAEDLARYDHANDDAPLGEIETEVAFVRTHGIFALAEQLQANDDIADVIPGLRGGVL